jgi:AraC family transcriptional regulator, regulatory protein of adaptative response / methylated-DNA-[protein]-cysteine methyltransferase
MNANTNLNFTSYEYISQVICFYTDKIATHKKYIITEKEINSQFPILEEQLEKWGNIALHDFIVLLNFINRNALPKYLSQNNLFNKKLSTDDFFASVHLNFFNLETVKNKYKDLDIFYNIFHSQFGKVLIASISDYVCLLYFITDDHLSLHILKQYFPQANFFQKSKNIHLEALEKINNHENDTPIQVIVHTSKLQEKVWKQLALLPYKNIYTYGEIAQQIQEKNASRAVGSAIGKNPIAVLIPCHRIIQASGKIGEFMWGSHRKKALLIHEILSIKK